MAMSSFDIKVSLEETAKLAWETFGEAWSFDDGGIDKHWLYTVQHWPMPASGNPGKIAKRFLNDLWSHMEKTYGVIKQPPRPTSARQASSWSSSRAVDGSHYQVLGLSPSECVTEKEVQSTFIRNAKKMQKSKLPDHVAESKLRELLDARDALHDSIRKNDESNRTSRKRRAADFTEPVIFVKAGAVKGKDQRSGDATCFPDVSWTQNMSIPDEEGRSWMEGRRDYMQHHIDKKEENSHLIRPTDTLHFSVLGVNMGNLNRHGQVSGYHHDNAILSYCVGKFHLALVTEARLEERARMTPKTYNVDVFESASGCQAIWILGNGENRRCKKLEEDTVWYDGVRQDGKQNWHLDYLIGEVFWGDHSSNDNPVTRCGIKSLRCGVAHLNNYSADKKREQMLMTFWQAILNARTQLVFGDFNKRAYLNKNNEADRPNNTMKQFLEDAISTCGVKVEFSMFRADAGKYPEKHILARDAEDDTMLLFLLDYKDVAFKITEQHIRQSASAAQLDNESLCLKSTDHDWHTPILLHVRSSAKPSGSRQRSYVGKKKRKQQDQRRRNERKRQAAAALAGGLQQSERSADAIGGQANRRRSGPYGGGKSSGKSR